MFSGRNHDRGPYPCSPYRPRISACTYAAQRLHWIHESINLAESEAAEADPVRLRNAVQELAIAVRRLTEELLG